MTEHQIHILAGVLLAILFLLGLVALFAFASRRRRAKTNAGKAEKIEFLNFDEAARRRKNNRIKRGKNGSRKK